MRKSEIHVFWATYQHMYKKAVFECNDLFNLFPFTKLNFYQKCFERKGSNNVHGWLWAVVFIVLVVVMVGLDVAVVVGVAKTRGHDRVGTNTESAGLGAVQVSILPKTQHSSTFVS